MYYHLIDDKEIVISFYSLPLYKVIEIGDIDNLSKMKRYVKEANGNENPLAKEKVVKIGQIKRHSKWEGLTFKVNEKEFSLAKKIAVDQMEKYTRMQVDLSKTNLIWKAGGFTDVEEIKKEIEQYFLNDINYDIKVGGVYFLNRMVELSFYEKENFKFSIRVDMIENKIVPIGFNPNSDDVEIGKKIAEEKIMYFFKVSRLDLIKNEPYTIFGEYRYSPLRRILNVTYKKNNEQLNQKAEFLDLQIDIDNGVIVRASN